MDSTASWTTELQTVTSQDTTTSRYEGLRAYLAGLPREQYSVELLFSKIEELIGGPLPAEASEYEWWLTDDRGPITPQSRAWEDAGFGIAAIGNVRDKSGSVDFVRGLHRYPGVGVASWEFGRLPVAERLRQLAIAYLESGKMLCVHLGENPRELTWPRGAVVCFCYRHAVELFLKSCILHRKLLEKCDHDISSLRTQYLRLYPGKEFYFRTHYDISVRDVEELLGGRVELEDFERKPDQLYRYFSDKQGRSPKGGHMFGPGCWLSMLDQLELDINRIWERIRASETST
jgi:hypothetical protein